MINRYDVDKVRVAFEEAGQGQVFRYWEELDAAAQAQLLAQAQTIDLKEVQAMVAEHVLTENRESLRLDGLEPAPYISLPENGGDAALWESARELGAEALMAGRVAAFCVAGGQGTRLGYDGPKGTYPVTPVSGKSLFQVFAEKIARSSERFSTTIHWFILTSEINNEATILSFRENDFFGLPEESVHFIVQGLVPAVDLEGKILLSEKGRIAMTPDGHGGSLRALVRGGAVERMRSLGVDCLSYFQVDNPLVQCIDPAFVGFHVQAGSDLSSKMVPKAYASEKVGHFCTQGGRNLVIEYSDMPAALQAEKEPDGQLRYRAGSVAIHIFDRDFIAQLGGDVAGAKLPFHRANKKIPFVNAAGEMTKPEEPNGVKFEMFVFDALPLAKNAVIIEAFRGDDFSPVKNAEGIDSPKTCAEDQRRMFGRWLQAAGADVPVDETDLPEAVFEISHRFAADQADFIKRWQTLSPKPVLENGSIIGTV